jgi:hypothetical protein
VPPGYAEALAVGRKTTRVLKDFGWKDDGNIFLTYALSETIISRGVAYVPRQFSGFLAGTYQLKVTQDEIFGQLIVKDTRVWSLRSFFRRRGGEPGDSLTIFFDLKNRIATVELAQSSPDELSFRPNQFRVRR